MKYQWEIAVAGLVHDIGKLYQKSVENKIGQVKVYRTAIEHTLIAKEFIETHKKVFEQVFSTEEIKFITECAVRHHEKGYGNEHEEEFTVFNAPEKYRKYCNIINIADNISSTERSETYHQSKAESKKENASLETPFTRMISTKKDDLTVKLFKESYLLDKWSNQSFRHKSIGRTHKSEDMTKHIINFDNEFDTISASSKPEFFTKINKIIKDYTWCIPSDSKEIVRDISLYQHLITTSAIASAIYADLTKYKGEEFSFDSVKLRKKELYLVNIKLSNVDKYILNTNNDSINIISEIEENDKELKEEFKSFFNKLIKSNMLTEANIVIDNGYNKYILVTEKLITSVENSIDEENERLLQEYCGEIYLSYKISDLTFEKTGEIKKSTSGSYEVEKMSSVLSNETTNWINGIHRILTKNKKWDTSKMILGITNKENDAYIKHIEKQESKISLIMIHGDNIDAALNNAFISNDKDYGTISRLCTYTSVINNFFNDYLKENFEDCKVFNIGNNKSILLCDPHKVINILKDLIDAYDKYTDTRLTLSCAIITLNINTRLYNLYDELNNKINDCISNGGNLTKIRDHLLTTDNLNEYYNIKNIILDDMLNGVDQAVFNRLSTYSSMYNKYINTGDVSNLKFIPLYNSHKSRDNKRLNPSLIDKINNGFNNIFKSPENTDIIIKLLKDIVYDAQLEYRIERK